MQMATSQYECRKDLTSDRRTFLVLADAGGAVPTLIAAFSRSRYPRAAVTDTRHKTVPKALHASSAAPRDTPLQRVAQAPPGFGLEKVVQDSGQVVVDDRPEPGKRQRDAERKR